MAEADIKREWPVLNTFEDLEQLILNEDFFVKGKRDLKKAIHEDKNFDNEALNKLITEDGSFQELSNGNTGRRVQEVNAVLKPNQAQWLKQKFLFLFVLRGDREDDNEIERRQVELDRWTQMNEKKRGSVARVFITTFAEVKINLQKFLQTHRDESTLRIVFCGHGREDNNGWGELVTRIGRVREDAGSATAEDETAKMYVPNKELHELVRTCIEETNPKSSGNIDAHFYYCFAQCSGDDTDAPPYTKVFHNEGKSNATVHQTTDPKEQENYSYNEMAATYDRKEGIQPEVRRARKNKLRVHGRERQLSDVSSMGSYDQLLECVSSIPVALSDDNTVLQNRVVELERQVTECRERLEKLEQKPERRRGRFRKWPLCCLREQ